MIEPKLFFILLSLGYLVHMWTKKGKRVGQELVVAAIISAFWVGWSGIYLYEGINYYFIGLNMFPLILWTAGLVYLRELYEKRKKNFWEASLIYVATLLIIEYVGYNFFGIHLASSYPGFLGSEALHTPMYATIYYLLAGPAFLKITDYLNVK